MPDHIHIFFGMKPNISLSDIVRDIKANSTNFINKKKLTRGKFYWQEGFGAFSCLHSQLDRVINYIMNQEKHHKKKTFKEEYVDFLRKYNVDYNKKYLFEFDS